MSLVQIGDTFNTRYIYGPTASLALDTDGTLLTLGGSTPRGAVMELTRLESDGSVISQNIVKTMAPTDSPTGVELQVLADGNLVALYHHEFRVFDANGVPITPRMEIPLTDFGNPIYTSNYWLSANPLTGGFSVIVGSDDTRKNTAGEVHPGSFFSTRFSQQDVRIAEFDANGHLLRDAYYANYEAGNQFSWMGAQIASRHTTLADGRVVVAYTDDFYNVTTQPKPQGTVFAGGGISVVILKDGVREAEVAVYVPPLVEEGTGFDRPQSQSHRPPVVVPSSLGGFAVLYATDGTWWARFYAGDNSVASDPILLSGVSGVGDGNPPPLVAMMSGGRIAVLSANATGLAFGDVHLTVFDKSGVIDDIAVAHLPSGSGVVSARDLVIGADDTIYASVGKTGPETIYRFALSEDVIQPGVNGKAVGTAGNDVMIGGDEDNRLVGGAGADRLEGQGGNDTLLGRAGRDHLQGNDGDDRLEGDGGNDELHGGSGNDVLRGGAGDDILTGGAGDDRIIGGAGTDLLSYHRAAGGVTVSLAHSGRDVGGGEGVDSFAGIEDLRGSRFDDRLSGDQGRNQLFGDMGDDSLFGGGNNDRLEGGSGDDRLFGQAGKDVLVGGTGKDILDGGAGNDLLLGGPGADTFVFGTGMGRDRIGGFNALQDHLQISADLADGMTAQELAASAEAVANGLSIDFGGGDVLILLGLTTNAGLAGTIEII